MPRTDAKEPVTTPDPLIVDTVTRLFADLCDASVVQAAEADRQPEGLWRALEETELPRAWVPEDLGGAGANLVDGFAIVRIGAAHAAPVPIAETLLAGWLLSEAGMAVPPGPMTVAPVQTSDELTASEDGAIRGTARRVPFASRAEHLVVVAKHGRRSMVALVPGDACTIRGHASLAGEALDDVDLDHAVPVSIRLDVPESIGDHCLAVGAAIRAHQMAGALQSILDQSLRYAADRVQFGRPIAKFQAVQHNLAVLAGEVAAAGAAADGAADALERFGPDDERTRIAIACAKIRAGEAAGSGAAIAHQVHGAIGFTREFALQQYTRRLWSWRDDFGRETEWAIRLGEIVARNGAERLWPTLTSL